MRPVRAKSTKHWRLAAWHTCSSKGRRLASTAPITPLRLSRKSRPIRAPAKAPVTPPWSCGDWMPSLVEQFAYAAPVVGAHDPLAEQRRDAQYLHIRQALFEWNVACVGSDVFFELHFPLVLN